MVQSAPPASPPPAAGSFDLPIADAASEILQIEPAAAVEDDFAIDLGDSFDRPGLRANFARLEQAGPLLLHRLRDVTLDASLMLLLRGRAPLRETRYLVTDDEYAATQVKPIPAVEQDPSRFYVIATTRAWHNYYHWLIQAVPAIDWSLRNQHSLGLTLVLPPLRPWQEEMLTLLGHQEVPRLTLDISGTYIFPSAEFSGFLGAAMPNMVSRSAVATYGRLSQAQPWSHGAADEIYVAAADAGGHIVANEAALISRLERDGVRIIVPGELSVGERIDAFRAARLVIGPHGAGLSNLVFCRPHSFVYEMLPRSHPSAAYNRIAQGARLNYCADLIEGGPDDEAQRGTWQVDLDLAAARLDAIRARIAATPRSETAMDFLKRTQLAVPEQSVNPVPTPTAASPEPPRPGGVAPIRPDRTRVGPIRRLFSRGQK